MAGGDDFTRKLGTLAPEIVREVAQSMYAAGNLVQTEAQISITTGAVSGKKHAPSRPGEPPNNDTGLLANSIETVQIEPLKVEVSSNAPYSAALEFGTSKAESRPFMAPAAAKTRNEVAKIIAAATARAMRKHFRR